MLDLSSHMASYHKMDGLGVSGMSILGGIDYGNVHRGTGPHSHAIVVVGSGITCLNVQTACVAHDHGNDLAVRGVPSGHYSVYGDTLLRDPLGVIPGPTNVFRQAAMWQI